MAKGKCSVDDGECSKSDHLRRDLCGAHYKRLLKYGSPAGRAEPLALPDLPGERWLPVPRYEDRYQVSDHGRVRSFSTRYRRGRMLKPFPTGEYGYLAVKLCCDNEGETAYVHRLVADNFIGPLKPGQVTRHGAGGHLDNRVSNLKQGSQAENVDDMIQDGNSLHGINNPFAKLTEEQVADIRRRVAAGETQKSAGLRYGVSQPNVSMLVRNKTWTRC